jgi:adenine-specific DNA-methyltransferase
MSFARYPEQKLMSSQTKQHIQQALQQFPQGSLRQSALHLLATLGYESDRQVELDNKDAFLQTFDRDNIFRQDRALFADWQGVDILFQLTDREIRQSEQKFLFDSAGKVVDHSIIESYLFMAVALRGTAYTRTQLAQATREVNRLFNMPVMLLFRHGEALTISIINRRLHKRDRSKDVLEKVTLIKDVRLANPHRAHIEILFDLSLAELHRVHGFTNFVELHRAWEKTLDSSELNKRFFKEIANWYFWAVNEVAFPPDAGPDETRNATSVIRLITRLMFVWFLKEKGLVPDGLFNRRALEELLTWEDPQDSAYYKAILQNLFFATLNQEMNTPQKPDNRKFRATREQGRSQHYMIHNLYRYERYFTDPGRALALFADIPFLNGGLFECLDRQAEDGQVLRLDAFSDRADNPLRVPDELFFGGERTVDLNETYGTSGKRYQVRGILETLNRYKFTITENTPIEEEIALDPELLGKVFENLLAAYNPETGTTARKQTGSFYTPREIVNYMVDESLLAYLQAKVKDLSNLADLTNLEERLRHLLAYNEEPHQFSEAEVTALIAAIDQVNILDPACGSGAFPMGILHKLVFILAKLDPHNARWKEQQIAPIRKAIREAAAIPDGKLRAQVVADLEQKIAEIEEAFARNELDYGRKLYLIENCIYGVDIQPVAVQIAKLRFFISLVVDQRIADAAPNRGVLPLPNLETKFVAANTLLSIEKPQQMALRNPAITEKEKELAEVRSRHFRARTPRTKEKWRAEDKRLRAEISALLQADGFPNETTTKLAQWDPYDQNASAGFFDPEWMFGLESGFDIVIGNPPYVQLQKIKDESSLLQKQGFKTFAKTGDIYGLFYERGWQVLRNGGILCFISSNKWMRAAYGEKLRRFFSQETQPLQLVDFGRVQNFEEANVDTNILLFVKQAPKRPALAVIIDDSFRGDNLGYYIRHNSAVFDNYGQDTWAIANAIEQRIKEKVEHQGIPIKQWNLQIYFGIKTGYNKAFIVDSKTREYLVREDPKNTEILKPMLSGRDIQRWYPTFSESWLINSHNGLKREYIPRVDVLNEYPSIYKWLQQFQDKLEKRQDKGDHWTNLRNCGYIQAFQKPKILWADIMRISKSNPDDIPRFAYDESDYYPEATVFMMTGKHLKYVLALLNSKLLFHVFVKFYAGTIFDTGGIRYKKAFLENLPLPTLSEAEQKPFEVSVQLVEIKSA